MSLSNRELLKIAWRTHFVRLFYNYHTLFGQGICYCLLPVILKTRQQQLKECDCSEERERERHSTFFNCNEYLAGLAAGIILKQEEEDPSRTVKVKQVITSTLGAVGDRFFYQTVNPLLLLATANLLYWFKFQPGAWLTGLLFALLIGYNLLLLFTRIGGVFLGYRKGVAALKIFKHPVFLRAERNLDLLLAFLQGITLANICCWVWQNSGFAG